MRLLAIETASEACSIALFEGETLIARDHRTIGRGHAETLVPMIAALPDKGRADRILVSLGPGSFTGLRIGLATARALGFAWQAEVIGYPTLALIAAMAQAEHPAQGITVCNNGGHGEWFIAEFGADGAPLDETLSLTPEGAATRASPLLVAGNRAAEFAALFPGQPVAVLNLLPDASAVLQLNPALFTAHLAPIYGRGPDATPLAQQVKA